MAKHTDIQPGPDKQVRRLRLSIDENNLVNEWKEQAALMLDYSIQLADAMQQEDETRAELAVVAAELDRDIRAAPNKFDVAKLTETAVANTVLLQPEHREATRQLDDARHTVRLLRAAVDALAHRKSSLQGMTDLWLRQWYADPTSSEQPRELKEAAAAGPPTARVTTRRRIRRPSKDED